VNPNSPSGAEHTYTIRFPSEFTGAIPEANGIRLRPTATYPWDGKYVMQVGSSTIFFLMATNFNPALTANFGVDPNYDSGAENWFYNQSAWLQYVKICVALPDGLGCNATDPIQSFDIKGVMLYGFDPESVADGKTYATSTNNPELALAPGYYTFDGASLTVHSGAIVSDPPPVFPEFGLTYRSRTDVPGTVGYTEEFCPP
jgi:hypothetical protein